MKPIYIILFLCICIFTNAQTFTWSNYNTSPGFSSISDYTESNGGVTMTLKTSTVNATGWESTRCGGATPRYRGTDFSPCMSPKFGLVWGVNWGDKTSSVTGDITFSSAISCVSFIIHDINRNSTAALCANIWTDVVEVTGYNGATPITPNVTQTDASQQTITTSGNTKIATANEASLGDGVTFSFSSPITRVLIVYKSGATLNSSTGCTGGTTNPANQFIVIGTISGAAANYGIINSADQAGCPPLATNAIDFSTLPTGATGYQWYSKSGLNACPSGASTAGWSLISGATASSYTPPSPAYSDITYACYVTVSCGSQWASGCRQIDVNTTNATSAPALSTNDYLWVSSSTSTITIDSEADANCTLVGFGSGSSTGGWYNGTARFNAGTTGAANASASYVPTIPQTGSYDVYSSVVRGGNRATDVPYTITHAGGTTNLSIDQSGSGFTWIYLGTFTFNVGTAGSVVIKNGPMTDAAKLAMADAIRFVKVGGSTDYELAANWLQWTGSGYQTVAAPPSTSNNVFIKPIVDCVYESPTVDNIITTAGAAGSANSNNITIASGATLNFSTNNSHLHINGNYNNQGTVNPGTGRVKFIKSGSQSITDATGTATFYEMNIASTSTVVLSNSVTVTNAIRLSGVITTGTNRVYLNTTDIDNSTSPSTGFVNYTGHIFGNLRRRVVTNTSNYFFPVGVSNVLNTGRRLLVWMNNNVTGITDLDCSASNTFKGAGNNVDARLDVTNKAKSYAQVLDVVRAEAEWTLTPNVAITGGNYGLQLYLQNYAAIPDNKFTIMKRVNASTDFFDFNSFYLTTAIPAVNSAGRIYNSGNGYAEKTGFTAFSKFVVATSAEVLPVQLLNYNIECVQNKAVLNWQTSSESNNHYFTIWRSKDGISFDSLAYLYGAGNSNQITNYHWADNFNNDIIQNSYYYNISQTNFSGEKLYFNPKFFDKSCDLGISVFPNPIFNKSTLAFYINHNSMVNASIYNALGQLVKECFKDKLFENGSHLTELNFEELSSGIYYLNVNIGGKINTLKISLQKE